MIFLLVLSPFLAKDIWIRLTVWGYLENLSTGSVNVLKGDSVKIGRPTEDVKNDVSLAPRTVSRRHLEIRREDCLAIDFRSLNGTTINAEFIPYGTSRQLGEGDIIVLAGIAPFRFSTSRVEKAPPPSGWGMLIDGRSRTVKYLKGVSASYLLIKISIWYLVSIRGTEGC